MLAQPSKKRAVTDDDEPAPVRVMRVRPVKTDLYDEPKPAPRARPAKKLVPVEVLADEQADEQVEVPADEQVEVPADEVPADEQADEVPVKEDFSLASYKKLSYRQAILRLQKAEKRVADFDEHCIHERRVDLAESAALYTKTKTELVSTKTLLDETKVDLVSTKTQLDETRAELAMTKADLAHTLADRDSLRRELTQTRLDLDETDAQNEAWKAQRADHSKRLLELCGDYDTIVENLKEGYKNGHYSLALKDQEEARIKAVKAGIEELGKL